ncbi:MAG: MBL fold metallo-hydrolase [Acidobacteria bacterium]|nr:MAG: MBL fold metallo-hydrolase [Acidobacteriota bacterium]
MRSKRHIPIDPSSRVEDRQGDASRDDGTHEIASDVAYKRLAVVNVVFLGFPVSSDWVLVDAGVHGSTTLIASAAEERFQMPPRCIVLTHGHFDHAGTLPALAQRWNVPIYAHQMEHPYLNGSASYPPPDPSVGGGLMARLSPFYPRGRVDLRPWLRQLPDDHTVPGMPDWTWIHTPGHTPGHVSLWRASDRSLIAGDAFCTTRQESAYSAMTQHLELHGPPMYFTQDFEAAHRSIERLAALEPDLAIAGHGRPVQGADLRAGLYELAINFDIVAVPEGGRYVKHPARIEDGTAYDRP